MRTLQLLIFSVLLIGCFYSVSEARTWHVAKDGSGDFSVIQDAVDTAESGDEIQIGPGRYDEFTTMHEGGSLYWDIFVRIDGKSLNLAGSGAGQTIIGPEDSSVNENMAVGISCTEGPSTMSVSGLSFENINRMGIWLLYGHLEVDNCIFRNGWGGINAMASEGAIVTNCHFENMEDISVVGTSPTTSFQVEDCTFDTVHGGVGFFWGNTQDCHVRNCTMTGGGVGRTGVAFVDGATGSVSNCYFTEFLNYGVAFTNSGVVACYDNIIEQDVGWGISMNGTEFLDFHDNIVTSNANCIFIQDASPMSFHNNHFFRGEGAWFVRTSDYYPYGPYDVDMSGNWWGTTDTAELDEWIYDSNDNELVWMTVNYLPLADGPVSTEPRSLGGLKALYR